MLNYILGSMFFYLVITSLIILLKKPSNEILFTVWYAIIFIYLILTILCYSVYGIAMAVTLFITNSGVMGVMLQSNKTKKL
jgi:hypothetical protein